MQNTFFSDVKHITLTWNSQSVSYTCRGFLMEPYIVFGERSHLRTLKDEYREKTFSDCRNHLILLRYYNYDTSWPNDNSNRDGSKIKSTFMTFFLWSLCKTTISLILVWIFSRREVQKTYKRNNIEYIKVLVAD